MSPWDSPRVIFCVLWQNYAYRTQDAHLKKSLYTNIFAEKNVSVFCICKSYSHFFFSKNTCELDIVLTRTVNILTTNELIKLTML